MKTLLSFIFMAVMAGSLSGQTFDWAYQLPGTHPGNIYADEEGNVYTTGYFNGTIDFDPGPGVNNLVAKSQTDGIFVQKVDIYGNLVWAKSLDGSINGTGFSIAVDNYANVYVAGYFRGIVDFDPGSDTFNLSSTAPSFNDIFILKLDPEGNLVWAKQLKDVYSSMPDASLSLDVDGNVYIAGFFSGSLDFDPGDDTYPVSSGAAFSGFILKLDSGGNFNWVNTFNTISSITDIVTYGNQVYLTGFFSGTISFDQDLTTYNYISKGKTDTFVLNLSTSGNFVWFRQIGGIGNDYGRSIALDKNENIFLTGEFEETSDFNIGSTSTTLTSYGKIDIFLQKFDNTGNLTWIKQIGGELYDSPEVICITSTGYLYLGGQITGSTIFNIGSSPTTISALGTVMFILQIDPDGQMGWIVQYPFNDITITTCDEYIYATGRFSGPVDFDPGYKNFPLTADGGISAFFLELGKEVITDLEFNTQKGISVYPNPVSSVAFLNLENNFSGEFTIRIMNVNMKTVQKQVFGNGTQFEIDMTGLGTGLYFLEYTGPGSTKSGVFRLIKN